MKQLERSQPSLTDRASVLYRGDLARFRTTIFFVALGIFAILIVLSVFLGLTSQATWQAGLDLFEMTTGWQPSSSGQ